jgi:ABC-type nitrate/sulfonate/bicarbonate transport system permease component
MRYAMSLKKNRKLPARTKVVFLLVLGLVIGVWQGYGTATESKFVIPQPKLIFELMMSLTFMYTCIWTIRKSCAHMVG